MAKRSKVAAHARRPARSMQRDNPMEIQRTKVPLKSLTSKTVPTKRTRE